LVYLWYTNRHKDPTKHHDDCYFCVVNVKGFNRYKKSKWEYIDLKSATQPIWYSNDVSILVYTFSDVPLSDIEETQDFERKN